MSATPHLANTVELRGHIRLVSIAVITQATQDSAIHCASPAGTLHTVRYGFDCVFSLRPHLEACIVVNGFVDPKI